MIQGIHWASSYTGRALIFHWCQRQNCRGLGQWSWGTGTFSLLANLFQWPWLRIFAALIVRMLSARMQNPASSPSFRSLFLCVCFLWLLQGDLLFIWAARVLLGVKNEAVAGYHCLGREENLLDWGCPFQNTAPLSSIPVAVSLQCPFLPLFPQEEIKQGVSSPTVSHKITSISQVLFHFMYVCMYLCIYAFIYLTCQSLEHH